MSNPNQQQRLKMHEAICRCPTCKGETNKSKLCPPCKQLDDIIDALPPNTPSLQHSTTPDPAKAS